MADQRFFRRFPHRTTRLRRSFPSERIAGGKYVLVHQVAPGKRMRLVVDLRKDLDVDDVSEAEARKLFAEAVGLMVA